MKAWKWYLQVSHETRRVALYLFVPLHPGLTYLLQWPSCFCVDLLDFSNFFGKHMDMDTDVVRLNGRSSTEEDQSILPVHGDFAAKFHFGWIWSLSSSVEVRLTQRTSTPFDSIRKLVHQHLTENYENLFMPSVLNGWDSCSTLKNSVEKIVISDSGEYS